MSLSTVEAFPGDTVEEAIGRLMFAVRMSRRELRLEFNGVVVTGRKGNREETRRLVNELTAKLKRLKLPNICVEGEEEEEEELED